MVTIDAKEFYALTDHLDDKQLKKAIKSGLRKSAQILRKGVQHDFRATVKSDNADFTYRGKTYKRKMSYDVKTLIWRNAEGATVSLHDPKNSRPEVRAYILRFLNGGTKQRKTKRGANRGAVTARGFFASGVKSSEGAANESMKVNIENAIRKAIKKV